MCKCVHMCKSTFYKSAGIDRRFFQSPCPFRLPEYINAHRQCISTKAKIQS